MAAYGLLPLVLSCTSENIVQVEIASVEVVPSTVNAVQGEQHQLVATVHGVRNEELPAAVVTWSSENSAIASVNGNGVLVALQPGTVKVHATYQGVSGSTTVVVLRASAIALSQDSVAFFSGVGGSPAPQTVTVTNAGTGTLGALTATVEYPAGAQRQWLSAELASSNVPTSLTLRASTQGLVTGTYPATVRLAAAANGEEVRLSVVLHLTGFIVSQTGSGTTVIEGGASDTISVILTERPSSNVVFDVRSSDASEVLVSRSTLVFTPANWNVSQLVTVGAVDDAEDDGNQTSTVTVSVNDGLSDDVFEVLPDQTVTVTTIDSDEPPPGFSVTQSGGGTRVTEAGGRDTISVVLSGRPTSNVVMNLVSADVGEATLSRSSLTFTPTNWNVAQLTIVTGVDDSVDDGDQTTTVTVSVNDGASADAYDPLPDETVTVITEDDDDPLPPAEITVTESGGSTRVTEAGSSDTITVVLASPPASNVVLRATSARPSEVTVSPGGLTFTPGNWSVPQRFVVTGVDDTADDGDQTTTVTISVDDAASDDRYDPLEDRGITVTTVDDDDPLPAAGFTVTETDGTTSVTEAGGTDGFSVVLTSPPLSQVVLSVTSANTAEATVSPASLTFSALNWNVPQQVTVTGVNDTADDGDRVTTITVAVNDAGSDDRFDPVADRTIAVTTVDDDDPPPAPAGFALTQSEGATRVTEAGGSDTISVVLTSPPASNVVLDVTGSDPGEASVTPASLTFTPATWDVIQRIVVTGVDDALDDGDQPSTVRVAVNDAASDDRFDPLGDQTATVSTVDDDPPPAGAP
jgi:hypothetical protein